MHDAWMFRDSNDFDFSMPDVLDEYVEYVLHFAEDDSFMVLLKEMVEGGIIQHDRTMRNDIPRSERNAYALQTMADVCWGEIDYSNEDSDLRYYQIVEYLEECKEIIDRKRALELLQVLWIRLKVIVRIKRFVSNFKARYYLGVGMQLARENFNKRLKRLN